MSKSYVPAGGVFIEPDDNSDTKTIISLEHPSTLVGQHLDGRFLIEKNLTETGADVGGIGVVYLARDTKLMNKQVVVKILQETALQNAEAIRKFQHEKEALIRIDHSGIVRILDHGKLSDGDPFMVMEYIAGHSLRRLLQNYKQLPLKIVAHIIESITDALEAAHIEKILHRDIKPENIMLTPQDDEFDRVKVIDFGIARVEEAELAPVTEFGRPIGTVLYIAPEQLIGSLELTPTVDIYSTAIVAYEMLTGELPFKPKNIAEMYQLQSQGVKVKPSELRPDIPRMAETILMSALEFDPAKRPQFSRTFGHYLAAELRKGIANTTDEYFYSIKTEYYPTANTIPAETIEPVPGSISVTEQRQPSHRRLFFLLIALGFTCLGALGYWGAKSLSSVRSDAPPVATSPTNERSLAFFLTLQKMRNGKPFEEPFRASGQEIFESGYKFNMSVQSETDGYIYLYNEGPNSVGSVDYYLLFPTPRINGGSSFVTSGQMIQTAQNTFNGSKGTELIWLIWAKDKNEDLDALMSSASPPDGSIRDPGKIERLRQFLESHRDQAVNIVNDPANERTIVKGSGDFIVQRLELKHR